VAGFIGTLWRESSTVVNRARIWVIAVANTMCQVVKKSAGISCQYSIFSVKIRSEELTEV
jgi:hypothetical protein